MQKVYLLLRNNQQTGPFNLEELVQFDLKPYDLIWIEGKSAGWYYPQEIKALRPYLPFVKQQAQAPAETVPQTPLVNSLETAKPKKVFVSMPTARPGEEMASSAASDPLPFVEKETYKPSEPGQLPAQPELKTTYAKSLEEVEAEYTSWVYQKKTKKRSTVSKKGLVAACLIVSVAFAGWWAVKSFSGSTNIASEQIATTPVQAEIVPDSTSGINTTQSSVKPLIKKQKQTRPVVETKEKISKQEAQKKSNIQAVVSNNSPVNNDYEVAAPAKEESKVVVAEKKPEPIAEAPKEKKKKLGEKILDLFKKKPEEKKDEEVKPAENENGERRTARRETNLATQVVVKFEIPNDWMMGIKGAKASFTNRNEEAILKATVEVQYYSEDNELLQTKTVSFSNIGAKKTATVSVPDHSFADHLDYKIISVQGAGEPFARR